MLTLAIGFLLEKTIGFRIKEEDEVEGVDSTEHAETGYDLGTFGGGARMSITGSVPRHADSTQDEEVRA